MNRLGSAVIVAALVLFSGSARSAVVINEVFYHAPNDVDDLEWIEVFNAGAEPADISGWRLAKGVTYTFPAGTTLAPQAYLVVARNPDTFRRHYVGEAIGGFSTPLSNNGAKVELLDAKGTRIDSMRYKDSDPWPVSADGCSSSLERISPLASGEDAANWAPSPMSSDGIRPGGTPGKANANYSANVPPAITKVSCAPEHAAPGEPIKVQATVHDDDGVGEVKLVYRVASYNMETEENSVPMSSLGAGQYVGVIPGQKANQVIRFRVKAVDQKGAERFCPCDNDLRPMRSVLVHDKYEPGKIPLGFVLKLGTARPAGGTASWSSWLGGNRPSASPPRGARFGPPGTAVGKRGDWAFIYVDAKSGQPTLFDYINIAERGTGGYKVRFHKDRTLNGMSVVNLVFEGNERFLLNEAMAYELYRRAGNAACLTDFIRVTVNGRLLGYHLLIEQPNASFLRRNKLRDDGNLFKVVWYGRGLIGTHEKKTNPQTGHADLVALDQLLQSTRGEDQWRVIEENFDVPQVINYFAVNMVLSHWDGYFNNYFTYHDINGTKKWTMYPWDQDKTWGYHDGIGDGIFFNMPLTFGMEGDRSGGGFGGSWGGGGWWRPGGYFSKPLLANPHFRRLFLLRTREIIEKVYTPEVFFPLLDEVTEKLKDEVRIRAQANWDNPDQAVRRLEFNMGLLREHLVKRRQFLLAQAEMRGLPQTTTARK